MTSGRMPGQRQASKSHSAGPREGGWWPAGAACACVVSEAPASLRGRGRSSPRTDGTLGWEGPCGKSPSPEVPAGPTTLLPPDLGLALRLVWAFISSLQSGSEPPWEGALRPSLFRPPESPRAGRKGSRRRDKALLTQSFPADPEPLPQCSQRPPSEAQGGPPPPFPRPLSSASLTSVPAGSPPRCPAASATASRRGRQPTWKVRVSPWPVGASVGADGSAWPDSLRHRLPFASHPHLLSAPPLCRPVVTPRALKGSWEAVLPSEGQHGALHLREKQACPRTPPHSCACSERT